MNFLAELLSTAEEAKIANIKEKIPKLVTQVNKLKCEVKNYMTSKHVDLKDMKKKSNHLLADTNKLNDEMKTFSEQFDTLVEKDIYCANNEIVNLYEDMKETIYALQILTQLVEIDNYVQKVKESSNQKLYLDAITNIKQITQIIKNIPANECLDIIQGISVDVTIDYENILNEISKIWHESVVLDKKIDDEQITLSIKINQSRSDEIKQSIKAMCFENTSVFELQCLANFLMNEIFTTLINSNCIIETYDDNSYSILTVKVNKSLDKMSYKDVFANIGTLFEFLSLTINFEVHSNMLLLGYVGQKISKQFCKLLIKNCIADTVPSTPDGLKKYDEVVSEIQLLQDLLVNCEFLTKSDESILEYANNVDALFANKTCQIYLDKAKSILKKDLHDMIEVGTEVDVNNISEAINAFPKCYISRNVNEYLDLIRKILDQANSSSDMCAGRLVYTAGEIIGSYYKLIPDYHKKLLETIPQQVALFYNNCIYFVHELLTINKYLNNEHTNMALKNENFLNHKHQLKAAGTNSFNTYVSLQTKQIKDILKESELMKLGQSSQLEADCEKHIRQCLRQLELLKTVWQKVLPCDLYNKTIGDLLNSFVDFLIKLVIGVEDISSDNCTLLVRLYGIVKTRAPKLFTEPREINLYVERWYKFTELILLLDSSLSDINDRWADGKGPLAVEFKPEEIKGLIRALFQNTDRRAAILAKIV